MGHPINIQEVGRLYHITFKTLHNRFALVVNEDIQKLASFMQEYKIKHGVKIFAFCIMSNHVHLLLKNSNKEALAIQNFLRDVKREYAKSQNVSYGCGGSFWSRSFRQKHIDGDIQFINTITYILNNPVEARLCERAEEYAYSSFHLLLSKEKLKEAKKNNLFLNQKALRKIYYEAKRQRYGQGLPDKKQAERGLGDHIDEVKYKMELSYGKRRFKRRGPWLHYFPETNRLVSGKHSLVALAISDEIPAGYRPSQKTLQELCLSRSQIPKKQKKSRGLNRHFKIDNMNIIFEAKSRRACYSFQERFADRLPANALTSKAVIKTPTGWALVAPPGRIKREA
jgi:putative transposase